MTQPSGGSARRSRGKIWPKATTTAAAGASSPSAARKAGSRTRSGCSTGMPCAAAQRATGGSSIRPPRPAGRAGWVTAQTGVRPAATSAASVGTAKSGVPKKTRRERGGTPAMVPWMAGGEQKRNRPVGRRGGRAPAGAGAAYWCALRMVNERSPITVSTPLTSVATAWMLWTPFESLVVSRLKIQPGRKLSG